MQKIIQLKNNKAAIKASESISQIIAQKAEKIKIKSSPEEAIAYYIRQTIECDIPPFLNNEIESILKLTNSPENNLSDPELIKHLSSLEDKFVKRNIFLKRVNDFIKAFSFSETDIYPTH